MLLGAIIKAVSRKVSATSVSFFRLLTIENNRSLKNKLNKEYIKVIYIYDKKILKILKHQLGFFIVRSVIFRSSSYLSCTVISTYIHLYY